MRLLVIAAKDLRIRSRDIGGLVLMLAVPMVVITVASLALSGGFGRQVALRLPCVDLDRSPGSMQLLARLRLVEGLDVESAVEEGAARGRTPQSTEAVARARITSGQRFVALLIPAGFGQALRRKGGRAELVLLHNPAEQILGGVVRAVLQGLAAQLSAEIITSRIAVRAPLQARERAQRMWQHPPVSLRLQPVLPRGAGRPGPRARPIDPLKQNVPGYAVMFALLTMIAGGLSLLRERQSGTLRRLLCAPLHRASLLGGKLLATFVLALMQMLLLLAFGRLALGLDLGTSPAGLVLLCAAVALAATSLGILMAGLVRTEGQLTALSILLVMTMSSLGGSWWPLEMVPDAMQTLAHLLTLNAWAMDGFKDLLWYGGGVREILPEVGALLLFSSVVFLVGLWRFRWQ